MKKILLLCFCLMMCAGLSAQQYQIMQASGFNADVIANGDGPALLSTSIGFDTSGLNPISNDYGSFSGLPTSGLVQDISIPGLFYQLKPYSENNSLRLQSLGQTASLTFANPAPAAKLHVLLSGSSDDGLLSGKVHFTDGSHQLFDDILIYSWLSENNSNPGLSVAANNFSAVNRNTDVLVPFNYGRLFRYTIDVYQENLGKTIASVEFQKKSAWDALNILAVTAELPPSCPRPINLQLMTIAGTSATFSWSSVPGATLGYEYYVGNSAPTMSTQQTGSIAPGQNILALDNVITDAGQCLWMRSVCSASEKSQWSRPLCFSSTTITAPYYGMHISTDYNSNPNTSITSGCPGVLTLHVPDGYVMTNAATSYQIEAVNLGYMFDQRSFLTCNGVPESTIYAGDGEQGTFSYYRNIPIANGLVGDVEFGMHAFQNYGNIGCSIFYNRVLADSWTVTATYEYIQCIPVTDVTAANVSAIGAVLTWDGNATFGYEYWLASPGMFPEVSQVPTGHVNENSINLSLLPNTAYCVWVRAACDSAGQWIPTCFTTPNSVTVHYTGGDSQTDYNSSPTINHISGCPKTLTVNVPAGFQISDVSTSYKMTAHLFANGDAQRSMLSCPTTGITENTMAIGNSGTNANNHYNRQNIPIANGATGQVNFELHAWRTDFPGSCDSFFQSLEPESWNVTVTLVPLLGTEDHNKPTFTLYPNPTQDILHVTAQQDIVEIRIFNMLGQQVYGMRNINAKEVDCDLAALPAGSYLLKLTTQNGEATKGVIKP